MIIKPIGNKSSGVRFTSDADNSDISNARARAVAFVKMNDNQIKRLAYMTAYDKKEDNKNRSSLVSALYAMPVAATLTDGILTKDLLVNRMLAGKQGPVSAAERAALSKKVVVNLSNRVSESSKTALGWGFGLVMLGVYNSFRNVIVSSSPKLKKFEQNNPFAALIADLGIFCGIAALGYKGAQRIGQRMVSHTPDAVANVNTMKNEFFKGLNKSKFNKKVLPAIVDGVEKFAKKAPITAGVGKFLLANSVWIVFFSSLFKGTGHAKQERDRIENNYFALKKAQCDTAKYLASTMDIERKTKAQDSDFEENID